MLPHSNLGGIASTVVSASRGLKKLKEGWVRLSTLAFGQLPVAQPQPAIAGSGDVLVVRDKDQRMALLAGQRKQMVQHLAPGGIVQVPGLETLLKTLAEK